MTEPFYSNCVLHHPKWMRELPKLCVQDHPILVRQAGDRVDVFVPHTKRGEAVLTKIGTLPPYETRRCLTMLRVGVPVDASLIRAEKDGPLIHVRVYASAQAVAKAHAIATENRGKKLEEIKNTAADLAAAKQAKADARKESAAAAGRVAVDGGKKAGEIASLGLMAVVAGVFIAVRSYWRWIVRVTNR